MLTVLTGSYVSLLDYPYVPTRASKHPCAITLCPRSLDNLSHFYVPTESICQLHLPGTAALGLQKTRAADDDHYSLSARRCDIESIQAHSI